MGALPGSFSGAPGFPEIQQPQSGWQPRVARFQPELFPDNPIALEGFKLPLPEHGSRLGTEGTPGSSP